MEIIQRGGGKFKGDYKMYTQQEADEAGIAYVPWREAREVGQWCLTDDEYVLQLIGIRTYTETRANSRERHFMTFPIGRLWCTESANFSARDFVDGGALYRTHPRQIVSKIEANRTRVKHVVLAYIEMLRTGKIDMVKLGKIYRPNHDNPKKWARKVLRNPYVIEMIKKEVQDALSKAGINEEYVANRLKDQIDLAEALEKPDAMLKGLQEVTKLLNMHPQQEQRSFEDTEFSYADEIDLIASGAPQKGQLPEAPVPSTLKIVASNDESTFD